MKTEGTNNNNSDDTSKDESIIPPMVNKDSSSHEIIKNINIDNNFNKYNSTNDNGYDDIGTIRSEQTKLSPGTKKNQNHADINIILIQMTPMMTKSISTSWFQE